MNVLKQKSKWQYWIVIFIVLQFICSLFFLYDAAHDIAITRSLDFMQIIETIAALSLFLAIMVEIKYLRELMARQEKLEQSHAVATQAFQDVIDAHYDEWQLTNAERDVATFMIKGLSITEIAQMRNSAEGTIKAHLNAIYRKAGVNGRNDLLSSLLESLIAP